MRCKCSYHNQIKKHTANTHNTTKQINALQIKFFIWLCYEYLQCVSLFVLWAFAGPAVKLMKMFLDLHVFSEVAVRWALSSTVYSRGLHGGPETRGPGIRTGSGLYFKWSSGSGSGPNLLLRVPGLLTLCVITESIGEHRTRQRSASVRLRMRVFL